MVAYRLGGNEATYRYTTLTSAWFLHHVYRPHVLYVTLRLVESYPNKEHTHLLLRAT